MSIDIYSSFIAEQRAQSPIGFKHRNQYVNGRLKEGTQYLELHHIKPRCDFADKNDTGINDPANLIYLTAGNHLKAHYLLTIAHPDHYGYRKAFQMMLTPRKERATDASWSNEASQDYSEHRARYAELGSRKFKNRKHTAETRQKMAIAATGKKASEETRKILSEAHTGIKLSDAHRAALSKAKKGIPISEETKNKRKGINQNRQPVSEETRLRMSISARLRHQKRLGLHVTV